jgi:hypothetical protein
VAHATVAHSHNDAAAIDVNAFFWSFMGALTVGQSLRLGCLV